MNILEELRNDAAGLKTLKDWIGDGLHPVHQDIADHRSMACVSGNNGEPCPHNKSPKWWERSKDKIAAEIKRQIEVREQLKLSTPFDDSLHMCSACGCCLILKIFTPMKHIKAHTPEGRFESVPSYCWQRIEAEKQG